MIRIYSKTETTFTHNGLGILKDTISCLAYEELNGEYSLTLEYPINGFLNEHLVNENIIKAPCGHISGNDQLFEIVNVEETLTRKIVTANHVSYKLNTNMLEDVRPTNLNGIAAGSYILEHTAQSHNFTFYSDIENTATAYYIMKNPIQALIGDEDNSFKNLWGGELVRDNFLIKMMVSRGENRGIKLIKGKNITGIQWITDEREVYTRIYPQGFNGLSLPEKYIDSQLINEYSQIKSKSMGFSDIKVDEANGITEEIALNQLRYAVQQQYENGLDKPKVTIKVDFVELSKTEQYKELYAAFESIYLADTVEAIIGNIHLELKIINNTYDCLKEKNVGFTIGDITKDYVSNAISQIDNIKKTVTAMPSTVLNQAKSEATDLITNSQGGFATKTQSEFMILDTGDTATAQQVARWNLNGFGFSNNGINGDYETAITRDGKLVLDRATVGQLDGQYIKAGSIKAISMEAGVLKLGGSNLIINSARYYTNKWGDNIFPSFSDTDVKQNTVSKNCFFIGNGTNSQEIQAQNGTYTISWKYKKLINLANVKLKINGVEKVLDKLTWTIDSYTFNVLSNTILIEIIGDTDSSCYLSDLMCNLGVIPQVWSSAQGESVYGKTKMGEMFEAESDTENKRTTLGADGLRGYNTTTNELVFETTTNGSKGKHLEFESSKIGGILRTKVGNQTWDTYVG